MEHTIFDTALTSAFDCVYSAHRKRYPNTGDNAPLVMPHRKEAQMKACPWCNVSFVGVSLYEAVAHLKSIHPEELLEFQEALTEYETLDPDPIDMEEGLPEHERLDENNSLGWVMGDPY